MIRIRRDSLGDSLVPQAIFWRPLRYFTKKNIFKRVDGFDSFAEACFVLGNQVCFSLRRYEGHPEGVVTLYLDESIQSISSINRSVSAVKAGMRVPVRAIAWRRGREFVYGKLERPREDRLGESEARLLVLKIAATQVDRTASVELIKRNLSKYYEFSPLDLQQSKTRGREKLWEQVLRNTLSSHVQAKGSPFRQGYAERVGEGLRVTAEGVRYLNDVGFSV